MKRTLAILPAVLALLGASLAPACLTQERERITNRPAVEPTRTEPAKAWSVFSGEDSIGSVIRFEDEKGLCFYSVRNEWHQDLGLIDANGRCYRFVPHGDPIWLGTGTVNQGVRRILALEPERECRLARVPLESLAVPAE